MTQKQSRSRYFGIGAIIYALVSAVWLVIEWTLGTVQNIFITGIGFIMIAMLVTLAIRHIMQSPAYVAEAGDKTGMWFGIIFTWEGIGIGVVSGILIVLELVAWIPVAVAIIVGLHFFPLGFLLKIKTDYIVGAALLSLAIATPLLITPAENWVSVIAYGTTIVLFIAGASRLVIGRNLLATT
jgi:hypothetical protein